MEKKACFYAAALVSLFMAVVPAAGVMAAYPEKPIEIIVHSGPGGGSDLFARQVASILEREGMVKQKMQVVNRTGGGATMAVNYLASKKGDPYTLMNVTTGPLTTVLRGSTRLKIEELVPIAMLAEDPNLAFTRFDSPFKDMKSVITEAKKNPRKVNIAIGTIGGSEHISTNRVAKAAGVEFNIVAFKGGGEAATALLGGHVDLSFGNVQEQIGQIEAKKIRPLATMTDTRLPFLPNVPTMREEGINAVYTQFRGFWAAPDSLSAPSSTGRTSLKSCRKLRRSRNISGRISPSSLSASTRSSKSTSCSMWRSCRKTSIPWKSTRRRNSPRARKLDPKERFMKKADRIFAIISLGLSGWLILESFKYDYMTTYTPGPGFHPFWLGICLGLLSLFLMFDTFRRKDTEGEKKSYLPEKNHSSGWA